jgi:hypothetical protein
MRIGQQAVVYMQKRENRPRHFAFYGIAVAFHFQNSVQAKSSHNSTSFYVGKSIAYLLAFCKYLAKKNKF